MMSWLFTVDGGLRVIALFDIPAHLHDARFRIGEIVLGFISV
jgi:hypothetical protein